MRKFSYPKIVLIIILILIVVSIVYAEWQMLKKGNSEGQSGNSLGVKDNTIKSASSDEQKTSKVDGSDWKRYRNEKYRVEIKYPSEWFIDEHYKYSELAWSEMRNPFEKPVPIDIATIDILNPDVPAIAENAGWVTIEVFRYLNNQPLSDKFIQETVGNSETSMPQSRPMWVALDECKPGVLLRWRGDVFLLDKGMLYHLYAYVNPSSVKHGNPVASCDILRKILLSVQFSE